MKYPSGLSALALALLSSSAAQADVVFNWVQEPATFPGGSFYYPFSLTIAKDVYIAAQSVPVTFGEFFATKRFLTEEIFVHYLGPDMTATALINVNLIGNPSFVEVPLETGIQLCNGPVQPSFRCGLRFTSTAVRANSTFSNIIGFEFLINETYIYSTFTLSGNGLQSNVEVRGSNPARMTTDANGYGMFSAGVMGNGRWQVDPSTIPASVVPAPPAIWLLGGGLLAMGLWIRGVGKVRV